MRPQARPKALLQRDKLIRCLRRLRALQMPFSAKTLRAATVGNALLQRVYHAWSRRFEIDCLLASPSDQSGTTHST